jgi:hypothetical protein
MDVKIDASECAVSRTEEYFTYSGRHHGAFFEISNTEWSHTSLARTEPPDTRTFLVAFLGGG